MASTTGKDPPSTNKPKVAKAPGAPRITREKWDRMLGAYRKRPTLRYIMTQAKVGREVARQAIHEGWPSLGYPPFIEMLSGGTTPKRELAKLNETWDDSMAAKGEAARQAAQEAWAARVGMSSAIKAAQLAHTYTDKVLEAMQSQEIEVPVIEPSVIVSLVKALEATNSTLLKAMTLQQKRSGSPQTTIGTLVIDLLERCSDDELDVVVRSGGRLPNRILGQKKIIDVAMGEEDKQDSKDKDFPDTTPVQKLVPGLPENLPKGAAPIADTKILREALEVGPLTPASCAIGTFDQYEGPIDDNLMSPEDAVIYTEQPAYEEDEEDPAFYIEEEDDDPKEKQKKE